jgi:uncharacterized coiled-coil protein SlyX
MQKQVTVVLLLLLLCMTAIAATPGFAETPFEDVPQGHWAYAHVEKLASMGIIQGYPDGLFKGGQSMTRYEMAEVVSKLVSIMKEDSVSTEHAGMIHELELEFATEIAALKQQTTDAEIRLDQHQQTLFTLNNRLDKVDATLSNIAKELVALETKQQPIPDKTIDTVMVTRLEELNRTVHEQDRALKRLYVAIVLIAALTIVK